MLPLGSSRHAQPLIHAMGEQKEMLDRHRFCMHLTKPAPRTFMWPPTSTRLPCQGTTTCPAMGVSGAGGGGAPPAGAEEAGSAALLLPPLTNAFQVRFSRLSAQVSFR